MTNIRYANKYRIRRFLIGKLHTEIVSKKALFNNVDRPGGGDGISFRMSRVATCTKSNHFLSGITCSHCYKGLRNTPSS